MKTASPSRRPEEIELKLALPAADPAALEKQLARLPALVRRKASHLQLHNVYHDTPGQALRGQRVALRLRQVEGGPQTQWLQTLKMGGHGDSALSQRGEWESPVPGAALDLPTLQATPWAGIDPDGKIFESLLPVFLTRFDRTSWTVRKRDGSVVEVSLDLGRIMAEGASFPLCELELELKAGQPAALFELARQIAGRIAVLPENRSKAERGYALAQQASSLPVRAKPPTLHARMPATDAAQQALREMFCQFTANLATLRHSDDAEVVHQARVGWRRFKSACRLFRPLLAASPLPPLEPLRTLLAAVGELRDLDVARVETLPQFAQAYTLGDAGRQGKWQAMSQALAAAAQVQREAVCHALETPAVGATLLAITQWIEELPATETTGQPEKSLRRWARHRLARLHDRLKDALRDADTLQSQHRARILAKRLRYGIEALNPLLAERRARRWHQQATDLQTRIGMARDVAQAGALLERLQADAELVAFMRGVAAGQARPG